MKQYRLDRSHILCIENVTLSDMTVNPLPGRVHMRRCETESGAVQAVEAWVELTIDTATLRPAPRQLLVDYAIASRLYM